MKKTELKISYDDAKLAALRQFMAKKGKVLDDELPQLLDDLYKKHVPLLVREYINENNTAN